MKKVSRVISSQIAARKTSVFLVMDSLRQVSQDWFDSIETHAFPLVKIARISPPPFDPDACASCEVSEAILEDINSLAAKSRSDRPDLVMIDIPEGLDTHRLKAELKLYSDFTLAGTLSAVDLTSLLEDLMSEDLDDGTAQSRAANLCALVKEIEESDYIFYREQQFGPEGSDWVRTLAHLKKLNSRARPLKLDSGDIGSQFWAHIHSDVETPANVDHGSSRFVAKRPLHPGRFYDLIEKWPRNVMRTRGTIWVAGVNDLALSVNQIGRGYFSIENEGYWLDQLTQIELDAALTINPEFVETWDSVFGDRETNLHFVFFDQPPLDWDKTLEQCCLSDFEMRLPWNEWRNPFAVFCEAVQDGAEI